MEKVSKVIIGFFIVAILVIAGLYGVYINKTNLQKEDNSPSYVNQTILFYSLTCPHCKNVEAFISENNVTQKINITQLEVGLNQTNANLLIKIGNEAKLEKGYIGAVPLLYSAGQVYVGDTPIIEYLNQTMKK